MTDINRRAEQTQRALNNLNRPVYAGAEATRVCKCNLQLYFRLVFKLVHIIYRIVPFFLAS